METIKKVRDILYENDIFIIENNWNEVSEGVFSVNLKILGLPCSTNGKSFNGQYALASAYGEFMERLQNLYLLGKSYTGNHNALSLSPSERFSFDFESFKKENIEIIHALFKQSDLGKIESLIITLKQLSSIPFYHVQSDQIKNLPYDLILNSTGSNGMCAGNIPEEALIQGLCEIFERVALKEIYFNPERVFPVIPENFFENTPQKEYISFLKENGFEVIIKDCSLNGKIPVIAVIVKKGKNALVKLGAAPDYIIAFERCITEFFQGVSLKKLNKKLLPIVPPNNSSKTSEKELKYQYLQTLIGTGGSIPETFLNNNETFYAKNLFKSESMYSKDILRNLLKLCNNQKWDVYIRDVSFLNFPAFYIYIPGLSEVIKISYEEFDLTYNLLPKAKEIYYTLESASKVDLQFLVEVIIKMLNNPLYDRKKILERINQLRFKKSTRLENRVPEMFVIPIMCKIKDYKAAYDMLREYLNKQSDFGKTEDLSGDNRILSCLLKFLYYLNKGYTLKATRDKVNKHFEYQFVDEIYSKLSDQIKLSEWLHIPKCNDCNSCNYKQECCYEDMRLLDEKLLRKMNESQIKQINIRNFI